VAVRNLGNWQSFWDLASPQHGAREMRALYGQAAAVAAADCAAAARADRREKDYRFWTAVLAELDADRVGTVVEEPQPHRPPRTPVAKPSR
jgi:phosphoserine phosphatase